MPYTSNDYGPQIDLEPRVGTVLNYVDSNRFSTYNAFTDVIAFGSAVIRGANYDYGLSPTATGGEFIGVAIREIVEEDQKDVNGQLGIKIGQYFGRLSKGIIKVPIETDIAIGDPVFFRHTDNGLLVGKGFRNDDDGGNADEITVGAKWFKPGLAGGSTYLELNLP
jgi:hypothetical protein